MRLVRGTAMVDTVLLAFDVDGLHRGPLLRPSESMAWMQALHETLRRLHDDLTSSSGCFTSKTKATLEALLLLPISHDARQARVDHVLAHVPAGFDEPTLTILERLRRVERKAMPPVVVVLVDKGNKSDFAPKFQQFGASSVWRSVTPFVPLKPLQGVGASALEQQVQSELLARGLPRATEVEVETDDGSFTPIAQFWGLWTQGGATEGMEPPSEAVKSPLSVSLGLRLKFDEPVQGPLVLGYAARWGTGQFVPE